MRVDVGCLQYHLDQINSGHVEGKRWAGCSTLIAYGGIVPRRLHCIAHLTLGITGLAHKRHINMNHTQRISSALHSALPAGAARGPRRRRAYQLPPPPPPPNPLPPPNE